MKILITGSNGQLGNELQKIISTGIAEIGAVSAEIKAAEVFAVDVDKLDIVAVTEDPNADVIIKGNENLKIGENLVVIETKNNEGDTNEYYLIVSKTEKEEDKEVPVVEEPTKEEPKVEEKDNKKLYLVLCMIISMCAIACIIILISRDIKASKEQSNKE